MSNLIKRFYRGIYNYFVEVPVVSLILMAVLIILFKDYLLSYFVSTEETGIEEIESLKENPVLFFLLVIIVGPLFETILYQAIPINVLQFLLHKVRLDLQFIPILVSALVFGIAHYYTSAYLINALIGGVIYAWFFTVVQSRKESAVIVVFLIHALKNLFVFVYDFFL